MSSPLDQPGSTVAGKSADMGQWKIVVYGSIAGSAGAANLLSDGEIATAAAASGAFDSLAHPEEDIYTLHDGREV